MPTRYGRSPWIDNCPKSRVPAYARYRGATSTDAVIIGGGLTGCLTAYAFAQAGVKVTLLEAERIGRGATAMSMGWIGTEPGPRFAEIEKQMGLRAARYAWQSWRRAALDFSALLRRLEIKCQLADADTLHLATSAEETVALTREHKHRKGADLDASLLTARAGTAAAGLSVDAALRIQGGAFVDPYRATIGIAAAAEKRGVRLCEKSPVEKVTFTRTYADVKTAIGSIRTPRVIVATGVPTLLSKALIRHVWFKHRFFALTDPVPAKIRSRLGRPGGVITDLATPPHVIRWVDDDRLLVAGADSDAVPSRLREKTLVQRTGQLMYELSTLYPEISGIMPSYGWDAAYGETAERLPYIGAHRNFPHHLFAFGDSSHGLAGAYLASRLLLRHHLGDATPLDDTFGFNR
ncbi:MAG: FAD-binding oxidoreductase [Acidobacteriaceae bacterium]|jgi:glycine/D-amino acid oxidase-like deaminating enzyme|nr:FAD-binding oxidoreductase [Acidobacteriaceae bacterium]